MPQGLSEPEFYGDLFYKLKKIVGSNNFSAQFIKIISYSKKIGYDINVLQQISCLVVTQSRLATLLSSLIEHGGSDFRLYDGSDLKTYLFMRWYGPDSLAVCQAHQGLPVGFILLWYSVLTTVEPLTLLYLLFIS